MLFNSMDFLVFFPIVVLVYFLVPKKARYLWLLVASYYFYMCWNAKYVLLLASSTIITYGCGLLLEAIGPGARKGAIWKKLVLAMSLFLNLGILFFFKYADFVLDAVSRALDMLHFQWNVPSFDIILPVGISFYIFQALGYTMDVYRNEVKAERNIFRYALFVSFFPQLVAGPIERSKNLLSQLREPKAFDAYHAGSGLLSMAYGLFLKVVLADNISVIVDPVFSNPEQYAGMEILLATALFSVQIYADFEGYTKLAQGSAEVLGYRLNENFAMPYLAVSVKDFWRRWHISLTSWFRDYLYIPLGGSRKGKIRKQINTMLVFLGSGLWHGAAWHYVVWGGLNGLWSILEDIAGPGIAKLERKLKVDSKTASYRIFRRILVFALIGFTWLFFRADSVPLAIYMGKKIITEFKWEWFLVTDYTHVFVSLQKFVVILFALALLCLVDILKYLGRDVKKIIFGQQIVFRWLIYWILLMIIIFWGAYGTDYGQMQFMYFQF